jgi:hypothetical protein
MFSKEQAKVLIEQHWLEVDMSFKRLKKTEYREVIFALMNERNHRSK